jgi:hypothetical protein
MARCLLPARRRLWIGRLRDAPERGGGRAKAGFYPGKPKKTGQNQRFSDLARLPFPR